MDRPDRYEELWATVRRVPAGSVASYGQIGRLLTPPTSGRIVGRWMFQVPLGIDIPWWRIVNAQGEMPIGKRDPRLEQEQRQRLTAEGVTFTESGRISRENFVDIDQFFD